MSRAKLRGVTTLALTDHDTISGLPRARRQAELEGIELVNGIEFSCMWAGRGVHVVALAFDEKHDGIQKIIREQTSLRERRTVLIAEKMEKAGFNDALDRACAEADGPAIGRPHFAQAMVKAGFCSSVEQAFKRYLGTGKAGDIKQIWPEFGDVLPAISEASGIAVLAHPLKYKLTRTKLCKLLEDFVDYGGGALEVVSGEQRPEDTRDLAKIANTFALLASCGSDFHAPSMHWGELGKFSSLPESVQPVWTAWE